MLVIEHFELQGSSTSTVLAHTGPMGFRIRGLDSLETVNVAYSQFVFVQFAMFSIKDFEPACCGNILSHIHCLFGRGVLTGFARPGR